MLKKRGGDESNLVIQHYKEGDGGWTPLPTTVNLRVSTAWTQVESLSMFALTIRAPKPVSAPALAPTSTAVPTPTPTPAPLSPTPAPTPVPTPTPPLMYLLEATVHPASLGIIGLNPSSNDWRYTPGTLVRATASCDDGFEGWTGDVPAQADPSSPSIIVAVAREWKLVANCAAEPPQRSSYALTINGKTLESGQLLMFVLNGTVSLNQPPGVKGEFETGSRVVLLVTPSQPEYQVSWGGVIA